MLLLITLILISGNLIQAKEFDTKDLAEKFASLELQLNEVKSAQLALTNQLKDNNNDQLGTSLLSNKQFGVNVIDVKNDMEQLKEDFAQHLNDSNANQAALNEKVSELVQQFKNMQKPALTEPVEQLNKTTLTEPVEQLNKTTIKQFTLPPHLSKLVGTRLQGLELLGPLSSASETGYWTWRKREMDTQEDIDTEWFGIMNGKGWSWEFSASIILPLTEPLIGSFIFEGYAENEMKICFLCFNITHNQDLVSNLPFKFDVRIRIRDQGFTEIQNVSFEVTKLVFRMRSNDSMPINKNWSKNKFPKDIEFLFL